MENSEGETIDTYEKLREEASSALEILEVEVLLSEYHEEWSTGRKYFDMAEYDQWKRQASQPESKTELALESDEPKAVVAA